VRAQGRRVRTGLTRPWATEEAEKARGDTEYYRALVAKRKDRNEQEDEMSTTAEAIGFLARPAGEVAAIDAAIERYGARAVHAACSAAYAGNRIGLVRMIGPYQTLATVHAADTAAFARMSAAERAADLRQANAGGQP